MKTRLSFALATLLALGACGNDTDTAVVADEPVIVEPAQPATDTRRETREAVDAIGEAGRATGEAASSAARDFGERAGPALDRAQQEGSRVLNEATQGLNNLTRSAACQSARAANDAEGIAANC